MEKLSKVRKAAILLVTLGLDEAAPLLQYLTSHELEAVIREISQMGPIDPATQRTVWEEFQSILAHQQGVVDGGVDTARQLLDRAFGQEQAEALFRQAVSRFRPRAFERLRRADVSQIAALVKGEHPQIIAIILAYMPAAGAAEILGGLPEPLQADVARRIATLSRLHPDVLEQLEEIVSERLSELMQDDGGQSGIATAATILNHVERTVEQHILSQLEAEDPALAEQIKTRLFGFDHLVLLDDRAIQKVLRQVDTKLLALALKGVDSPVRDKIMHNLSQRAAELLREEISVLGPVRVRDVEKAQRTIVQIVRDLEDRGEITIWRGEADELVW